MARKTLMDLASEGVITEEMKAAAAAENVLAETIARDLGDRKVGPPTSYARRTPSPGEAG